MREFKATTKAGQNILNKAQYDEGWLLDDVYCNYSGAKERAWKWCFEQYQNGNDPSNFRICSHNTFGFTCAWEDEENGEPYTRFETKDNSYRVWLNQ